MRSVKGVPLLLGVAALLSACGRTTIDGCVHVTGPRGEQQRASGATVMLIPASKEFDEDWQAVVQAFREDYERAHATYERALSRYRSAQITERRTFTTQREAAKTPALERYTVYQDSESGARVWSNQQPPPGAWLAASDRAEASRGVAESERRLNAARNAHLGRAVSVINKHSTASVSADLKGCYTISSVPIQRVYVFANHGERYWLREVGLRNAPERVDFWPGKGEWVFSERGRSG